MEDLMDLWAVLQPLLSNYVVLAIISIVLVCGVVKKIVKLAVTAGVLILAWVVIQQIGVPIPM